MSRPKRRSSRQARSPTPTRNETTIYDGVPPNLWDTLYGEGKSISVGPNDALGIPTYWRCVNLLSALPAALPARIVRGRGKNQRRENGHVADYMLNISPDDGETNAELFRRAMGANLAVYGTTLAECLHNGRGDVGQLRFLEKGMYNLYRDENRVKWYQFSLPNGHASTPVRARKVVHLVGFSMDAFNARSPISIHRETLERSVLSSEHKTKYYAKGGRPSGVISVDGRLQKPAKAEMQEEWKESLPNGTAILSNGAKYQPISIPPEDSKFLEGLRWDAELICQIMNVPPYMAGIYRNGSEIKAEELALHFMTNTLIPLIRMWECELTLKLFASSDLRVEFDLNHLIRASISAQGEFFQKMTAVGGYVPDDIRIWLGQDPHENNLGQKPLIGANNYALLEDVVSGKYLETNRNSPSNDPGSTKTPKPPEKSTNLDEGPISPEWSQLLKQCKPETLNCLAQLLSLSRGNTEAETDTILSQEL